MPAPSTVTGATPVPAVPERPAPPPWGLVDVALAAAATLVTGAVLGGLVLSGSGQSDADGASLVVVALLQATLWVGMLGAVLVVLRVRRASVVADLGLRFRPLDAPLGLALGVACQLVLVPVVSWPWIKLLGQDAGDLEEPACRLAAKADDPVGVVLLFLITVIGAPLVEELFFRGFTQRPAVARLGRPLGLGLTAVVFGLTHFQPLQLPALVAFGLVLGLLADRTGRQGPGIVTHMAFNATTVVSLVVLSSSVDEQCRSVIGVLG